MKLSIKDITVALSCIARLTDGDSTIPGVMLDIKDNYMNVCYSNGRKALIKRINIITDVTDLKEKVVLDYTRLNQVISECQPSGIICVDEIEMKFNSEKIVDIIVEKKIKENGEDEEDIQYRRISVFRQSMGWSKTTDNMKVGILDRMDYDSIFNCDTPDVWEVSKLKSVLSKTSTEKSKVLYLSKKYACGFVANLASLTEVPIDESNMNYSFMLQTQIGKAVADIVSKVEVEEVSLFVNGKNLSIFTEDKDLGVWITMAEPSRSHLETLSRYRAKEYKNHQITFIKDTLKNVVSATLSATKSTKTSLKFRDSKLEEGFKELVVNTGGSSAHNEYSVLCIEYIGADNNINDIDIPVSLQVVLDILNKCESEYVGLDIDISGGAVSLRIADINFDKKMEEDMAVRDSNPEISPEEPVPDNFKLEYRVRTLDSKYYTIASKE